ncbi:Peptidoglycan-synthase activator, LpoB-like [Desulfonema limicola]|uniref:Peptidoglycan-synthase activator, LpoB-like n=1 Tax=Desulfonema limicola TaxID=45656 RepID=A0A975B3D9_9BACT|nr:penicillin-binding protein activator LpoB [Desulfonema limicola]QTA78036.1 Peptidoglycan-synthase activator, LpoB-like [Desulfonema limicola]
MKIPKTIIFLSIILICFITVSCQTTTRNISTSEEMHYDEAYDFSDKKKIVDSLVEPLLAQSPLSEDNSKPVIIIYGIANDTSEHINTSGITDDIRLRLLKSGRFRFVNETQRDNIAKETGYQYSGAVDPSTQVALGRQLGAKYMLSGTLRSIEKEEGRGIRVTKKSLRYYSLNLELTDLKTSLITWADSVELAREASRPIIGW